MNLQLGLSTYSQIWGMIRLN
ncbi:hypothetical protein Godav_018992 [Gossypium davidsonii]|uniref:Uncharacterized protein n=1 Tax=Gossypium davidsonii TaxID=34287 RepID=A0A7J8QZ25_GOSDV|nr:hypothetical protein [Gossypium davidsonii]